VLLQRPDDPGEIEERAAQAVNLVDHDAVHAAGLYVLEEALEGGAIHVAACVAAVIVARVQALPAFAALTGDVRLGRFALGVEAVELLVKPLVRGLARVDRASDLLGGHLPFRSPKKWYPFQWEPVTALATADSDR